MSDLPPGQENPNYFDSMREDQPKNPTLEQIVDGFERNPMELCTVGGRTVSFQTAYYVMMKYKTGQTHAVLAKDFGITEKGGLAISNRLGLEGRNAMMDMLGLSETHLANIVHDATYAMKKRKVYKGDEVVEEVEEADHDVRLKAVDIAGKWRGMKPKDQIEITGMNNMSHEKVVEIVRKMGQEIIPGQHKMIENGKKEKEEETKKDS